LVGDRTAAWVIDGAVAMSQFRYSLVYKGGLSYDILVVGNSRAVHSVFAPEMSEKVCLSVFNAAFDGMSGDLMEALLLDYLDHNASPKAVLIEVSNATQGPNLASEMRLFAKGHLRAVVDRLTPFAPWWESVSHLYRFDNEMTLRALYYRHRSDQDWIASGPPMTDEVISNLKRLQWDTNAAGFAAIVRLGHELRDRGITPIFYVAPLHPVFGRLVPEYDRVFKEMAVQLGPEFPIIDMSTAIRDNGKFVDVLHTNIFGSRVVMTRLSKVLDDTIGKHCPN
jgi:hypothetical protein